jgi:phytoene desaturase
MPESTTRNVPLRQSPQKSKAPPEPARPDASRQRRVVIVGSGFGGLAAAVRLQARGYQVELLEARDKLGGRAYVYEQDGFTFDGGPTVVTAPFLFDEIFAAAGRRAADYVNIVPVDPFYRIEFHDGRSFEYNGDSASTERRVADFSPGDVEGYRRMIHHTKKIFEKGFVELSDRPFLKVTDMLKVAPDLVRLQSYRTVYSYVSKFVKDPLLRRVFSFHPLLVGGNPFQTTSIYALIHHLEQEWGVHYAMGGTGAIVAAMGRLFEELGGRFRLSCPVRQILVENGAAVGVETAAGDRIAADAVVSNADVANTYRKLIPAEHRRRNSDRHIESLRYSMSLFVLYFGTRKQYHDIHHHTIILGERYRGLLDDIFNRKHLAEDFSLYLHRPTATDPSMAPEGCDSFYVLAPVPNQLSGLDWRREAKPYRNRIMKFLDENHLPGLRDNLATELMLTPLDFETTLNSYLGSGFSVEPVLQQSAWFRPHNESEDVRNLFLVGAGTHPGAGMPGVLSSAKIAEKLVCDRIPV